MRRREVLAGLFGGAVAGPLAARAQSPSMPVVGFLSSAVAADQANFAAASVRGLREAGFDEGQTVTVEYRWAEGHYDRLPALARELVERGARVIIAAGGSDPAKAAKAAAKTVPIVFVSAADPVRAGLVESLSRPEGNITGVSLIGATLEGKRLELLHELVPRASAIGVLLNPDYPALRTQIREVEEVVARLKLRLVLRQAAAAPRSMPPLRISWPRSPARC